MRRYGVAEEPRKGMRGSLLRNASHVSFVLTNFTLIKASGNDSKNIMNC